MQDEINEKVVALSVKAVSYTHLDVYKRQAEALGMTLPGAALVPATMRDILQYARYAGRTVSYTHLDVYKRQGLYRLPVPA